MKIRTGFVSNSSSSSYVVLIPNDFDVDDFVYANLKAIEPMYREQSEGEYGYGRKKKKVMEYNYIDDIINRLRKYIKGGSLYGEDDYLITQIVTELMGSLIIKEFDSGCSEGDYITFIKEDEIFDKLNSYQPKKVSEADKKAMMDKANQKKKSKKSIDP